MTGNLGAANISPGLLEWTNNAWPDLAHSFVADAYTGSPIVNNVVGGMWNATGDRFYIIEDLIDRIYYNGKGDFLNYETNANEFVAVGNFIIENRIRQSALSADGTRLYLCDVVDDEIHEYSITSPTLLGDPINTDTFTKINSLAFTGAPRSIQLVNDDTQLIIVKQDTKDVGQVLMSTPADITTGVITTPLITDLLDYKLSPDGKTAYALTNAGVNRERKVVQFDLSVRFDLSTSVLNVGVGALDPEPHFVSTGVMENIAVSPDGHSIMMAQYRAGDPSYIQNWRL